MGWTLADVIAKNHALCMQENEHGPAYQQQISNGIACCFFQIDANTNRGSLYEAFIAILLVEIWGLCNKCGFDRNKNGITLPGSSLLPRC